VTNKSVRRLLLSFSILLYMASLCFEAIPGANGLTVLGLGWMEFMAVHTVGPFVAYAWFANLILLLVLSLDSFGSKFFNNVAKIFACAAAALSIGYAVFGKSIVTNESGSASTLVEMTPGYLLWVGSILAGGLRAFLAKAQGW
jgi:hypothetical protein